MGVFRRRSAAWAMYSPLTDGDLWTGSFPWSPVPLPGHAVVRQRDAEVTRVTGREWTRPGDRHRQVDLRRRLIQVHPQRIPTADGIPVTVTLVMHARTVDPVVFVTASQGPDEEIYLAAQIALREYVAGLPLEELVGVRADLTPLLGPAQEAAAAVGVEVSAVQLKDLSLPEGYSAALEASLVAKVTAETDLERARTEVKTTRARLASAKVLEQNPVLARIRMLEALPEGSTIEVRGDGV